MKWTRTPPTVEGFYWVLAKRNEGALCPPTPEVVQVMNAVGSRIYLGCGIGNEGRVDEMELWGEEPLQPPDEGTENLSSEETPRWKHDHDCCTFLGRHGDVDLYGCDKAGDAPLHEDGVVFMARYSDEPSDYTSNTPDPRVPEWEAKRRWYARKEKSGG